MDERKHVLERIIRLDGTYMTDRPTTHQYLRFKFYFPDYYGNNLDALYDLLTEISEPTKVIIYRVDELKSNQPDYGRSLLKVFRAAQDANPLLTVRFMEGVLGEIREYRFRSKRSAGEGLERPVE